jgi:hypothetical protein
MGLNDARSTARSTVMSRSLETTEGDGNGQVTGTSRSGNPVPHAGRGRPEGLRCPLAAETGLFGTHAAPANKLPRPVGATAVTHAGTRRSILTRLIFSPLFPRTKLNYRPKPPKSLLVHTRHRCQVWWSASERQKARGTSIQGASTTAVY